MVTQKSSIIITWFLLFHSSLSLYAYTIQFDPPYQMDNINLYN